MINFLVYGNQVNNAKEQNSYNVRKFKSLGTLIRKWFMATFTVLPFFRSKLLSNEIFSYLKFACCYVYICSLDDI
jgi:hypothetical protein